MKKAEYDKYIRSPRWRGIRKAAIIRGRHRCFVCSEQHRLQVHHTTYARVGGDELPGDLMVLCEDCHSRVHAGIIATVPNPCRVRPLHKPKDSKPKHRKQKAHKHGGHKPKSGNKHRKKKNKGRKLSASLIRDKARVDEIEESRKKAVSKFEGLAKASRRRKKKRKVDCKPVFNHKVQTYKSFTESVVNPRLEGGNSHPLKQWMSK